jgi:2-dehydropantoate 2-reductase
MKIATLATGGIGGFLAARLGQSGHEVVTIARSAHLDAIRTSGLRLITDDDDICIQPAIATDKTEGVGPVDAIIFGVKGDDLEAAAEACRPMLKPETVVVPFLNGVEAADRLVKVLPPENVANGVAYISTTIAEPGVIRQVGAFNRFLFAERDNRPSPRIEALRQAIDGAGSSAPVPDDVTVEVWRKFVLFSAMSGVTAAGRCTLGSILGNEYLAKLFQAVIAETAAVGRSLGVALPDTIEADIWKAAQGMPPAMQASTAIDLAAGKPIEVEWITGAVTRLAGSSGIDVPANRTIYALLSPYKNGSPAGRA